MKRTMGAAGVTICLSRTLDLSEQANPAVGPSEEPERHPKQKRAGEIDQLHKMPASVRCETKSRIIQPPWSTPEPDVAKFEAIARVVLQLRRTSAEDHQQAER